MKALSIVFIVLAVVGILLGIAYPIVCQRFTGKSIGTFDVFAQDIKSLQVGRSTLRSSKQIKKESSIPLDLSPGMNPISVVAKITRTMSAVKKAGQKTVFAATLSKDGNAVWEERIVIRPKSKSTSKKKGKVKISTGSANISHITKAIRTFDVAAPGQYLLEVTPDGENEASVTALSVTVKTNVTPPKKGITIIGGIMGVIGILGWIVINALKKKQSKQTASA